MTTLAELYATSDKRVAVYVVANSNHALYVDPLMERLRASMYAPILMHYGNVRQPKGFDYAKYEALDPMARCFDNAIQTAQRYGLNYVEGVVWFRTKLGPVLSLAHGWCEDEFGNVVDPTLHKMQGHPSLTYHGVHIRMDYATRWKASVGYWGCLDGSPSNPKAGVYSDQIEMWLGR